MVEINSCDRHEVIVRGLHQHAVIRTQSFSGRVKENRDKNSLVLSVVHENKLSNSLCVPIQIH